MKYMVIICKHHDGFSQFDSKLTDCDIMASPYGKDIIRQFAEACHHHGMRLGLYYSTRDWYNPDYLVGDNTKYDAWYRGQVEELLSNYGAVDLMWFDHVGGRDWGKWKFDELFAMMYRHQPKLLVNDRAARFCGPQSPEDRRPASPEIQKMTAGDFSTPEGRIGALATGDENLFSEQKSGFVLIREIRVGFYFQSSKRPERRKTEQLGVRWQSKASTPLSHSPRRSTCNLLLLSRSPAPEPENLRT